MSSDALFVFLLSALALTGELLLTRLLSFKYLNHEVYSIIAIAILGYGVGNLILSERPLKPRSIHPYAASSLALALVLVLSTIGILLLPVSAQRSGTAITWGSYGSMIVCYSLALIPFILIGYSLAEIFRRRAASAATLYMADLTGAGAGVLLFFFLISRFGATHGLLLCAMFAAIIALLFPVAKGTARNSRIILRFATVIIVAALAIAIRLPENRIPIAVDSLKEIHIFFAMAAPEDLALAQPRWYPQGRVDLIRFSGPEALDRLNPSLRGTFDIPVVKKPDLAYFTNDGMAGTPVYHYADPELEPRPFTVPMEAPYLFLNHPRVCVIGAGGGRDFFMARMHGASRLLGAEINQVIHHAMTSEPLASWTGHIYARDGTRITMEDGRQLVRRCIAERSGPFDLIILNGVDSYNAIASGACVFSESYLYTTEAIADYLALLSDTGILNMNRWFFSSAPRETLRLFVMAYRQLLPYTPDPGKNIIIIRYYGWGIMMIRKTPYTDAEIMDLMNFLTQRLTAGASADDLEPIYLAGRSTIAGFSPHTTARAPFHAFARAAAQGSSQAFIDHYPYNIAPVTDDMPFFYRCYKPLDVIRNLSSPGLALFSGERRAPLMQFFTLFIAVIATLLFFDIPLKRMRRTMHAGIHAFALYFAMLGLGFIFIEIALIQQFILLLGHPMYSMAAGFSLLLIGSGCGSLFWNRGEYHFGRRIVTPFLLLAASILGLVLLQSGVSRELLHWSLPARVAMVALYFGMTGFLMGGFFPCGLGLLAKRDAASLPWAMALNTGCTVCGTLLAVMMSQAFGFRHCLSVALLFYLTAVITLGLLQHQNSSLSRT